MRPSYFTLGSALAAVGVLQGCVVVIGERGERRSRDEIRAADPSRRDSAARPRAATPDAASRDIAALLDSLHAAASKADGERYFSLFADDAVFLGTDAAERWTIDQFRDYAQARFDAGQGWTYAVIERHIVLAPGGDVGWFDERLMNAKYGECRGTGVVVRTTVEGNGWRIAQYNLTTPIPNDLLPGVAQQVREYESAQRGKPE